MSAKRYKRPDLKKETVNAISSELHFLVTRITFTGLEGHFVPGTVDPAIYYEETRVLYGVQLHSTLLVVVAYLAKPERWEHHPNAKWLRSNTGRIKAAYSRVCEVAVEAIDAEFFRQIGACLDFINRTPRGTAPKEKEPFKAAVLYAYMTAKNARFEKDRDAGKLKERIAGYEVYSHTHPSWHDVDDAICSGISVFTLEDDAMFRFSRKDVDLRRRQIEAALKKLGLPYTKQRQIE